MYNQPMEEKEMTDLQLARLAVEALENAYAPYSRFRVGAALVTDDGAVFVGVNVENASYGLTVCAERVAIFNAVSSGHRKVARIAVACSNGQEVFPCGACRQVLHEFGPGMKVVTLAGDEKVSSYSLASLLPHSFGPQDLQK